MTSKFLCLLVVLSLYGGLGACTGLGRKDSGFPVALPLTAANFPPDAEVLAVVELSTPEGMEKFLLALGTSDAGLQLSVLTPQGVPLYKIDYTAGARQISHKSATGRLRTPDEILGYLGLIYFEEGDIEPVLTKGWHYRAGSSERLFERAADDASTGAQIRIRYKGEGPWYRAVRLVDSVRNTELGIRTLEYRHVVPE